MTSLDLFDDTPDWREEIAPGAVVLRGFARGRDAELAALLNEIEAEAPFRYMVTPGGFRMSVAMTNCGERGWVTDRFGYRYQPTDPMSGRSWPPIPAALAALAREAAAACGYPGFDADACLVNRYEPGARMSLHQDRNERDLDQPIVSISLGLPAAFLFGGMHREDKTKKVALAHGDVAVWGGPARLRFHGILPLKPGNHPFCGPFRINLTFRKAG